MLLPHWTEGCIGSMEGLYFEASTTTPFHFINQDEVSEGGSNAQRGMPYGPGAPTESDFDRGVQHLQMLGVRYYMAYTPEMTEFARAHPSLTEIAIVAGRVPTRAVPPGRGEPARPLGGVPDRRQRDGRAARERAGRAHRAGCRVTPATPCPSRRIPAGGCARGGSTRSSTGTWIPTLWSVPLAESGPDEWERVAVDDWMATHEAPATPLDPVTITDITTGEDEITFSVDQVGVPVLVRTSYFPNWKVEGADGPYRVSPNLMVVVPDRHRRAPLLRLRAGRHRRLGDDGVRSRAARAPGQAGPDGHPARARSPNGIARAVDAAPVDDAAGDEAGSAADPGPTGPVGDPTTRSRRRPRPARRTATCPIDDPERAGDRRGPTRPAAPPGDG